jgi:hypothetical protein
MKCKIYLYLKDCINSKHDQLYKELDSVYNRAPKVMAIAI